MSISQHLIMKGYKLIDKVEISRRLQFERSEPILHSVFKQIHDKIVSGGVQLTTFEGDQEIISPLGKRICQGVHTWLLDALIQSQMLGWCVSTVNQDLVYTAQTDSDEEEDDDEQEDEDSDSHKKKRYRSKTPRTHPSVIPMGNTNELVYRPHRHRRRHHHDDVDSSEDDEDDEEEDEEQQEIDKYQLNESYLVSRIIDLERVDTYIYMHWDGQMDWKFIIKSHPDGVEHELTGLRVFVLEKPTLYPYLPPSSHSSYIPVDSVQLNSLYNRIQPAYNLHQHNLRCHAQSSILMTNPQVVAQDIPQKENPDASAASSISYDHMGITPNVITNDIDKRTPGIHPAYYYEQQQLAERNSGAALPEVILSPTMGTGTQMVYLPDNKALVKQNIAASAPYILEFQASFQQLIYLSLNIPLGVQYNINPDAQRNNPGIGQSYSGGGTKDANQVHSTAYELYQNTIRSIRTSLLEEAQAILDEKTQLMRHRLTSRISASWIQKQKRHKKKKSDEREPNDPIVYDPSHLRLMIELPGLPDDSVVTELYRLGVLKPEAFNRHKQKKDGFSERDLFPTAQLTLKEINGIQTEVPQSSSSSASKKKPKKKKAKK